MSLGGAIPDDATLKGPFVVVPGVQVAVTSGHEMGSRAQGQARRLSSRQDATGRGAEAGGVLGHTVLRHAGP